MPLGHTPRPHEVAATSRASQQSTHGKQPNLHVNPSRKLVTPPSRERWKKGRWVKVSWTPEQRDAILRQDEEYRQADARWALNHGPAPGGAVVLPISKELVKTVEGE